MGRRISPAQRSSPSCNCHSACSLCVVLRWPPVCCWNTSMVSSSSMSRPAGVSVSFIGWPSNRNRTFWMLSPARSQYVVISFRSGVCFLILKCTTLPSCPTTFRLMCSLSGFTSLVVSFVAVFHSSIFIRTPLSKRRDNV